MNSKSLEYEDVLYFDLQPQSMACTQGSVVMEWKQTLQGSYIWKISEEVWGGMEQRTILDQYLTSGIVSIN